MKLGQNHHRVFQSLVAVDRTYPCSHLYFIVELTGDDEVTKLVVVLPLTAFLARRREYDDMLR